jgi:thioesterase domain-containing protein
MARQLEKIGEKVEFLGLFDVQPLDRDGDEQEEFTERDALVYFATLFDLDPQPFTWMEIEEGLHQLLQQAKKRGDWPQGMTLESMRRKINVLVACGQATTRYRYHGPINSDLHLFRVSHVSKHGHRLVNPEEWATRTTGKLQIFPVPGDHNTMGSPPHVDELAKAMKSAWAGISKSLTRGGV